jgi:MYXO-CTERM domain-containing protein
MRIASALCVSSVLVLAGAANASTIITQWDFNAFAVTSPVTVVNNPAPSTGAGLATPVGMTNNINAADIVNARNASGTSLNSTDPIAPTSNRGWRVRGNNTNANGWSGTTQLLSGARFNASTVGYTDVSVSFDMFATDGSPRHAQFQYTLDGTNFISLGSLLNFGTSNDVWTNGFSYNLSSIAGAANNPNFGFQVVSAFSPVEFTNANGLQPANTAFQRADGQSGVYTGGAGNYRFDMVTFSGTIPTPGAMALLGLAGLAASRRRRA